MHLFAGFANEEPFAVHGSLFAVPGLFAEDLFHLEFAAGTVHGLS